MSEATPAPDEVANTWLDEHENKEKEAVNHFSKGNDALDGKDYSRAMMRFEKSEKRYKLLEKAVEDKTAEYENGSTIWETFSTLGQYYYFMREAAAWRYSTAYEIKVNDDPAKSAEALETSNVSGLRN